MRTAAELYRLGKVRKLLMNGDNGSESYDQRRSVLHDPHVRGAANPPALPRKPVSPLRRPAALHPIVQGPGQCLHPLSVVAEQIPAATRAPLRPLPPRQRSAQSLTQSQGSPVSSFPLSSHLYASNATAPQKSGNVGFRRTHPPMSRSSLDSLFSHVVHSTCLALVVGLSAGCNVPDPPPVVGQDGGTPPGADAGSGDQKPDTGPLWGGISLSQTQLQAGSFAANVWSASAVVRDLPSGLQMATKMVGTCKVTTTTGMATLGRGLDAGDLTISGGLNGPVTLQYNAMLDIYAVNEPDVIDPGFVANANTPVDPNALFDQTSQLALSAAGGPDLKMLSGLWHGVTPLSLTSAKTLAALPLSSPLVVSWVAAPQDGAQMLVSLASSSNGVRIDCAAAETGSYSVSPAVMKELGSGSITLTISRLYQAQAQSDRGALPLEARSSWQIKTSKP